MKNGNKIGTCLVIVLTAALALTTALFFAVLWLFPVKANVTSTVSQVTPHTPPPSITTATPEAVHPLLQIFPLLPGTTWTYSYTQYSSAPGQPNTIIEAEFEVTQTVVEAKTVGTDYIARVQQNITKIRSDEGWTDQTSSPPGDGDFWYVLHDNQVYTTFEIPQNLDSTAFDLMTLEYQFPMQPDAQWCPNRQTKEYLEPVEATPYPCQFAGMRIVHSAGPQQTQVGNFEKCYQMGDVYNSGGVNQTFCEGVGIVERKYDHGGSRFGFSETITAFDIKRNGE